MKTLMIAAMHSGAGKTVTTCAILSALKQRGVHVQAFKCGPDYIDPMFHERVLNVPSRNLDLFLQGEEGVIRTLSRAEADLALIEGAMGYYDGLNNTTDAGAYALARLTKTPAVLAISPGGSGLTLTAGEIDDLSARIGKLGEAAEKHIDLDRLLTLAGTWMAASIKPTAVSSRCRIAVARDEAFCFTYADSLDALREAGAELAFFSPLRDLELPNADGLYLPGGYPELYAETLSENLTMIESVAAAVKAGLPTVAECGGFLYLGQSLEDEKGRARPMCGVLPGAGFKTGRLQRFGYQTITAPADSLLFRAGEQIPAHEFHYWDSTQNGADLIASKADGRSWNCGYASPQLYAAFPHLHFGGALLLGERFVKACEQWKASMT